MNLPGNRALHSDSFSVSSARSEIDKHFLVRFDSTTRWCCLTTIKVMFLFGVSFWTYYLLDIICLMSYRGMKINSILLLRKWRLLTMCSLGVTWPSTYWNFYADDRMFICLLCFPSHIGLTGLVRCVCLQFVKSFWRRFFILFGGRFVVLKIHSFLVKLSQENVYWLLRWFFKVSFRLIVSVN